jgi:structural maintenance of chromosome 2
VAGQRVKGTVAANLRVADARHNTALEALAGGRLYQVIVDDDETGMLLLTKGQLTRRVTLIPLKKIRPYVLPQHKVAEAQQLVGRDRALLASSLLEFDASVEKAMLHVFGGALVCTDKEAARTVCEKLALKTVTLDGDLYDPAGTLTGGSRPKADSSVLQRAGQLRGLRSTLAAREAEAAELSARLDAWRQQAEKHSERTPPPATCDAHGVRRDAPAESTTR